MRPGRWFLSVVFAVGCGGAHPLGSVEEDNVAVSEAPGLEHVQAALHRKSLMVKDLFTRRNLDMDSAPTPAGLLRSFQELNGNHETGGHVHTHSTGGSPLTLLTYNVALVKTMHWAVRRFQAGWNG